MKRLMLLLLIAALTAPVQAAVPEPKGAWEFNQPDTNRATIGEPLQLVGTVENVPGVHAADGAVQIGEGSYYVCTHGIAPNGGGAKVNQWTLLIDFSYPPSSLSDPPSGYNDLFQLDPTNADDSDWTINSSGAIGIGAVGYSSAYGYTTQGSTWYRMVLVVENGVRQDLYVDGVEIFKGNQQGIDGRFSLADVILLFCAGNNQDRDDAPMNVSTVAIWDRPLSATEIAAMGQAGDSFFRRKRAFDPIPTDGADDVPITTDLTWTAGEYAATHNVYFGSSWADVDGAAPATLIADSLAQDVTRVEIERLDYGRTYYWRVDEVNAAPDRTVFAGDVWSFTTEPFAYPIENIVATTNGTSDATAGPEKTIDGSGLDAADQHSTDSAAMWLARAPADEPLHIQYEFDRVYKLHEMLVWNYNVQFEMILGFGLKDVTVAYSEDGEDWTVLGDVEFARATGTATYAADTTVAFGGAAARYVRLTVNSGFGGTGQYGLSEVRFLFVPAQAREPHPADGAVGVDVGAALSWRSGRNAASHEVYLGTDPQSVDLVGTIDQAILASANLIFGTTYYWQVVEVNEAEAVAAWAGDLWSFSTQEYAPIDGFESYTDDIDAGEAIFDTWIDGWVNNTGSTVGYLETPFAERTIVRSGRQSMPLFYDNTTSPFYSETERTFATPQNWTGNGADTLRLFVAGQGPAFFEAADGTILMNAIGNDIWGNADQFRYVYKNLSGNGSVTARVDMLDISPDIWVKAGVMIRQNAEAGAINTFMAMTGTGGGGSTFQQRMTAGGASVSQHTYADGPFTAPYWVRVTREGNTLRGYTSPDGENWIQRGDTITLAMTDPVLIGLALTSHNANQATSAQFSNVAFTGNVTGAWQVAEVGVAQPAGNAVAPLYVALEDATGKSAVVTHPDANIVGRSGWNEWQISLSEFAGVNLSRVSTIAIGVGSRTNPVAGGTGMVFIDDIGFGRPAGTE
ncbi:discoidin domain-containing protein [Anaerobaca lacustris]|uniref:Discoidin domain-containing protein n=1 Tax=Anaerobaca lacustris TaxID=3044600 RepID=A0AAW6TVM5_9BACT|nr:discoidin domain-containing protein [Sedimentisphaerales bacterium M17dextr]